MRILYIAYSCDPFNGSEDQIGWNIPIESEKQGNEVYILTKKDHEKVITEFLKTNNNISVKVSYIDVPKIVKKICKRILYSMRIILWQRRALRFAKKIVQKEQIQIIHQIGPMEFRAIGNYGKLNTKYILGPIGGGFPIPKPLNEYAKGHFFAETTRKVLNCFSLICLKVSSKIQHCDYVLFCNEETKSIFDKYGIRVDENKWEYHCEIGIPEEKIGLQQSAHDGTIILLPGRIVYRKGLRLLFDAIPRDVDSCYKIMIAGDGPLKGELEEFISNDVFLRDHVEFLGRIPFYDMIHVYSESDAVVSTSLSEGTGSVLLESLAMGKPIITSRHFGAKVFFDDSAVWFFNGNSKNELVNDLTRCLRECILDYNSRNKKSKNALLIAQKYTWSSRVKQLNQIYNKVLNEQ